MQRKEMKLPRDQVRFSYSPVDGPLWDHLHPMDPDSRRAELMFLARWALQAQRDQFRLSVHLGAITQAGPATGQAGAPEAGAAESAGLRLVAATAESRDGESRDVEAAEPVADAGRLASFPIGAGARTRRRT